MAPNAIAARIWSNYTVDSCHNVASLFGNNDTYSWRSQHDCPDAVLPSLAENYSPEANYSYASLVYRTPARMDEDEMDWSNFTPKVFPEEGYEERAGSRGSRGEAVRIGTTLRRAMSCHTAWRASDSTLRLRRIWESAQSQHSTVRATAFEAGSSILEYWLWA